LCGRIERHTSDTAEQSSEVCEYVLRGSFRYRTECMSGSGWYCGILLHCESRVTVWYCESRVTVWYCESRVTVWYCESRVTVWHCESRVTVWYCESRVTVWYSESRVTVWYCESHAADQCCWSLLLIMVVASVAVVRDLQNNHSDSGNVCDSLGNRDLDNGVDNGDDDIDDGIDCCNSDDSRNSDYDRDHDIDGNCDNYYLPSLHFRRFPSSALPTLHPLPSVLSIPPSPSFPHPSSSTRLDPSWAKYHPD
jgi:hypothetical protein